MTDKREPEVLHVAVGVIRNKNDDILIARRNSRQHQGGKWEFPGGKVEAGECVSSALTRELKEELNIEVLQDQPLCQVHHRYPDRHVFLDVREVTAFTGTPQGMEGQPIQWQSSEAINPTAFPSANMPIVRAVRLPRHIAVVNDDDQAKASWPSAIATFSSLPQNCWLRLRKLTSSHFSEYCQKTRDFLTDKHRRHAVLVDLDADGRVVEALEPLREEVNTLGLPGWGYYANRDILSKLSSQRIPLLDNKTIGASCHSQAEYELAVEKGMDFVIASPVLRSASHLENPGLGWTSFAAMANAGKLPCFAMGGLCQSDLRQAREHGAYGIAGISLYR